VNKLTNNNGSDEKVPWIIYLLKQVMSETLPLICPAQIQDDHFGLVVSNIGEAVCKLQKGCSRLAAASNKAYQLLAMVGGFLRVLRLLPPLKLVVMI
jgi:hypothetical protein